MTDRNGFNQHLARWEKNMIAAGGVALAGWLAFLLYTILCQFTDETTAIACASVAAIIFHLLAYSPILRRKIFHLELDYTTLMKERLAREQKGHENGGSGSAV